MGRFIQPPVSANYFWPPVVQHAQSLPGCLPLLRSSLSLPQLYLIRDDSYAARLVYLLNFTYFSISLSLSLSVCFSLSYLKVFSYLLVPLLWSKSVDELVNLVRFPLGLVPFHTDKNTSGTKLIT